MARRITSLNWIRVFEAAARTSSFARAAERLAMSPPAVSQQIRALEHHLGRRLFHRAAKGVSLTDDGRALLSACSTPLARIEAITEEFAGPRQKTVVIGASLMLSVGWLTPRLPEFLAQHPEIKIDLRALMGRPEQPDPDVALWIAFGPYPAGLVATRLFGERLTPVATTELAGQIRSPDDLLNHVLIEPSAHETTWAKLLGLPVLPASTKVVKVDNTLTALELAASHGGIALARAPATDRLVARLGLVPCLDEFSIIGSEYYHMLHHENASLSKEAAVFMEWLNGQAQGTSISSSGGGGDTPGDNSGDTPGNNPGNNPANVRSHP
ncbi:MAG: LysR family transcriptional regulator [Alphaproteobacteria bacterium]|nr:LysR family transcriptional regulator [Alphaproteobacteria bacterium]